MLSGQLRKSGQDDGKALPPLGKDRSDYLARHVSQPEIPPPVTVGQLLVIEPEQM